MTSNKLGFVLIFVVMAIMAVWTSPEDPMRYLDGHGAFVVIVGTIVIALIALPLRDLRTFLRCLSVVARKEVDDRMSIVTLFVEMASAARNDLSQLERYVGSIDDKFFKDALGLLTQGLELEVLSTVLRRRLEVQRERENSQAKMFKNLGKYPPACGLIGTVMGMIALLGTLGEAGGAQKIGPAMAVALSATLYGVLLANFLILPVGDNLMTKTQQTIAKREMIVEGILLLKQRTNPVIIREMLISHLPPALREGGTAVGGGAPVRAA